MRSWMPGRPLFVAGWPQGIAPPGLPRIRTCPLGHTARHIMKSLRDGSLSESAPHLVPDSAIRCCFVGTVKGFDAPAMVLSNGVMTWRPLLSTGSLGMVPLLRRYDGRSDSPPSFSARFDIFTSRYRRSSRRSLPSVVGGPPEAKRSGVPGSSSGMSMETSGALSKVPWKPWWSLSVLFDPSRISQAEWTTSQLPDTVPACVHDEGSTRSRIFRGSITRPLTWLSTLRRMGCPITTQDSLLAAGPALPGGIRTRRVSGFQRKVSEFESLPPFQSFPDARTRF